jgi:tRNA (guanine37-N1)-methyltransferase
MLALDVSPPVHRWMNTTLDRDAFKKTILVLAARVPAAKTGYLLNSEVMRKYVASVVQRLHLIYLEDPSWICQNYAAFFGTRTMIMRGWYY